jgi:hypothetical protein
MPSLIAMLGLNASRFKGGLDQSIRDAKIAGGKLAGALNEGDKIHGLRHIITAVKELAEGNLPAAARSVTMLGNEFGALKLLMNPITAAIVGLGAGIYAAYKLTAELTEKLSGLKFPEMRVDYIAKHLQKINMAAEAQKEINKEVEHSIELYNSAAKAAERQAKATQDHYAHLRKVQEYAKEAELAEAKTEGEKANIRKKYSDLSLNLSKQERDAKWANKQDEANTLAHEAEQKKAAADKIIVNSKAHDDQILAQRKKAADEAQKYLDNLDKSKGGVREKLVRGYNAVALSGVSGKDLDLAESANKNEAHRRIESYKQFVDASADYEEQRRKKTDLYKEAGHSAAAATTAALEAEDMKKAEPQTAADQQEEAFLQLDSEAEKGQAKSEKGHRDNMSRNNMQAIGAYGAMAPHEQQMLDVGRRSEGHLQRIEGHLQRLAGGGGSQDRSVAF